MTTRRAFMQWLAAGAASPILIGVGVRDAHGGEPQRVALRDDRLVIEFDPAMRCRLGVRRGGGTRALTRFDASETLEQLIGPAPPPTSDGPAPDTRPVRTIERFAIVDAAHAEVATVFGAGRQLRLVGRSADGFEKTLRVTLLDARPGVALIDTQFRNAGTQAADIRAWSVGAHRLLPAAAGAGGYWTYSGASHADRRDWVQPVKAGFDQRNFMGMNASDYGGGTPVVDVWRRDLGIALGHLDTVPRLVSLPVRAVRNEVALGMRGEKTVTLAPGATLDTPTAFVMLHDGDYFVALDTYRQMMGAHGFHAPQPPASAYEPIWCAWGYERQFSLDYVRATLPKVRELGFKWAVLDDGWQRRTGDWVPDRAKFPAGDADMKALVDDIHASGQKARLWIAPLAVAPGSDELHDHTDMLLLDADGAPQAITWWNSFYLCPAYEKTQAHVAALVKKVIGEWGFDGMKIDGQHLNGVAPCFNPAHSHARPEDSVEHLADFYRVFHDAAHAIKPDAVVEVCPCGTAYAFHNMRYIDQAPASDPLSSWQVRHKGKTLKALMGASSAFAGDHVELSDGGRDFASAVGVGAVISTKFTWPVDPKPKNSFLLTPEREQAWRHWVGVYNAHRLAEGRYRGELYDIAFDKPETHVVEKDGVLHYACYAERWNGAVALRGLQPGRSYRIVDYANGNREVGRVAPGQAAIALRFEHAALLRAEPLDA
ncbi:glycoside hydrolase family 36 protein [Burkholderia stabilis]|uniref:glycoside hydrolase family 36 protein n=1 Tax=Burkholderia stabilis TaxID=95485 RepID=UPI001590903F|nr:glycoside hydrolase family 36 protein [Burkholderia stabilis]